MFQDAYIKLESEECEKVLSEINPVLSGGDFDPKTAVIMTQPLRFYPGYSFLEIADYDLTPMLRKFVIYKPGSVTVIDWTNAPVYELNKKAPLSLDADNVCDYVRFFLGYVRGPEGALSLAETIDDINWSDEPPPAARKAVGQQLKPVKLERQTADGDFIVNACFIFKNVLYQGQITVSLQGRISISDEKIMIDDLPLRDSRLG
ncbi:MAG: hypothetical protein H6867_02230 [Rhodospirillales bacterium]|nr:hypothetical protein [Rhodospirillales bacterium]MCB9997005.1 hypothetical protein [Rhodospirillales bacterium]